MKKIITESQIRRIVSESVLLWLQILQKNVNDMMEEGASEKELIDYIKETLKCNDETANGILQVIAYSPISESKKRNAPKDEVAAINKANRDADIANHGKPCELKSKKSENPKAYNRKKAKCSFNKICDEAVNKAINSVLKENINEIGDTPRGQYALGKLYNRKMKRYKELENTPYNGHSNKDWNDYLDKRDSAYDEAQDVMNFASNRHEESNEWSPKDPQKLKKWQDSLTGWHKGAQNLDYDSDWKLGDEVKGL